MVRWPSASLIITHSSFSYRFPKQVHRTSSLPYADTAAGLYQRLKVVDYGTGATLAAARCQIGNPRNEVFISADDQVLAYGSPTVDERRTAKVRDATADENP